MHAAGGEVVEVVVREKDPANQHGDHPAHIQSLRDDIAQNAEQVGDGNLGDFAVDQEPEISEEQRAGESWVGKDRPQAAPMPSEAETVSRNFQVIYQAI